MKLNKMKKKITMFHLGIVHTCFSVGLIIVVILDITYFPVQPWPYVDGGGMEYILLYRSLFWVQYIAHCQFLLPSFLGLLVWKYWIIPFTIGLTLTFFDKSRL